MEEVYYLVEVIGGEEYNVYSGTEKECEEEKSNSCNKENMYISCNRTN